MHTLGQAAWAQPKFLFLMGLISQAPAAGGAEPVGALLLHSWDPPAASEPEQGTGILAAAWTLGSPGSLGTHLCKSNNPPDLVDLGFLEGIEFGSVSG